VKIAFVVGTFPVVTETFIINQVADLLDRGVDVEVFAFARGGSELASRRYAEYRMAERTRYVDMPSSRFFRCLFACRPALRLLRGGGSALVRYVTHLLSGSRTRPLPLLYGAAFFAEALFRDRGFDVVHCHFGTVGVEFLDIAAVLGARPPVVVSLYGYDVSLVFRQQSAEYYDRLKRESRLFFVMSNDMKARVVAHGFPADKVEVLPVSIDVAAYPYSERTCPPEGPVQMLSVGRLVEKKGFDHLLRALSIVRGRSARAFHCSIVGGGELEGPLRELSASLGLDDRVDFLGPRRLEEILELMPRMHVLVAASRTAADGDME
jgi:colanic acid/amylovoran biosynthesis glycosyltransferase